MQPEPTVFVVDDDEAVCRALGRLIESMGLAVETFPSANEFLDRYQPSRSGCLVLDMRMPGMSGLELQTALAERNGYLPIIFITAHGDVPMSVQAMKGGAVDFIQKPFNEQTLLDAIHKAIAHDAETRRKRGDRDIILQRLQRLTPRERDVLQRVVAGRLNKQIAMELSASEKTIKIHRARVMRKMEADSLADLVLQAQMAGIVGPTDLPSA
jgi:FixJ family two-component response regulator